MVSDPTDTLCDNTGMPGLDVAAVEALAIGLEQGAKAQQRAADLIRVLSAELQRTTTERDYLRDRLQDAGWPARELVKR